MSQLERAVVIIGDEVGVDPVEAVAASGDKAGFAQDGHLF